MKTDIMSMRSRLGSGRSLAEMQTDLTRKLILDTAVEILEHASPAELTVRGVAKRARISERTIFRYFPNRDEFLDAIAEEVMHRLETPPPPRTIDELHAFPEKLFRSFEAKEQLIKASLHSELFPRIRRTRGRQRMVAIRKLIDEYAPTAPERSRKIATSNIRFFLAAMGWHYYRYDFGFSLEETIASAEFAIRNTLKGL